jgi:hypothetical protein
MEEGAAHTFKVPPHSIEFTLPSPRIGVESMPVVDPPWMPHVRTRVQEVTLNQDTHVSLLLFDNQFQTNQFIYNYFFQYCDSGRW